VDIGVYELKIMHHVHTSGAIPGTLVFGWISDNYGRYTAESYQEIIVRSAYFDLDVCCHGSSL
jgi:sugar phosphate permease